jgi:hypothetical protein
MANAKIGRLRAYRMLDVPLREVSGICLRRGSSRRMSLLAVGDRVAKLAQLSASQIDDLDQPEWEMTNIAKLPGSRLPKDHPQIEAVCSDGIGRVLLLQEWPPRVEVIDLNAAEVIASIELVVEGRGELARLWADRNGSHGEGIALLRDGRLLIAKEKDPPALIEFGFRGTHSQGVGPGGVLAEGERWPLRRGRHEFVALAVWFPEKALAGFCADFSDLEVGPDGLVYLLSDKSAAIVRLDELSPGGGTAAFKSGWRLGELNGKPEGLTFTASGQAIVALDRRKPRQNLIILEPAIMWRRKTTIC